MKVRDLIKRLESEDPEAEVHMAYTYPDHWRTMLAPRIRFVDEIEVVYSDYHRETRAADESEDAEPPARKVVALFADPRV